MQIVSKSGQSTARFEFPFMKFMDQAVVDSISKLCMTLDALPLAETKEFSAGTTATATHVAKRSGHVAVQKKPAKKPSKLPQPPNEGDPPLSYRAGYVGTSWSSSTYRAVVGRSDRRVRWDTGVYTRKQAFAAALEFIDERS